MAMYEKLKIMGSKCHYMHKASYRQLWQRTDGTDFWHGQTDSVSTDSVTISITLNSILILTASRH